MLNTRHIHELLWRRELKHVEENLQQHVGLTPKRPLPRVLRDRHQQLCHIRPLKPTQQVPMHGPRRLLHRITRVLLRHLDRRQEIPQKDDDELHETGVPVLHLGVLAQRLCQQRHNHLERRRTSARVPGVDPPAQPPVPDKRLDHHPHRLKLTMHQPLVDLSRLHRQVRAHLQRVVHHLVVVRIRHQQRHQVRLGEIVLMDREKRVTILPIVVTKEILQILQTRHAVLVLHIRTGGTTRLVLHLDPPPQTPRRNRRQQRRVLLFDPMTMSVRVSARARACVCVREKEPSQSQTETSDHAKEGIQPNTTYHIRLGPRSRLLVLVCIYRSEHGGRERS